MRAYVGIVLHRRRSVAVCLDEEGDRLWWRGSRLPCTEALAGYIGRGGTMCPIAHRRQHPIRLPRGRHIRFVSGSTACGGDDGRAELRGQFACGRLWARVFTHAPDDWRSWSSRRSRS